MKIKTTIIIFTAFCSAIIKAQNLKSFKLIKAKVIACNADTFKIEKSYFIKPAEIIIDTETLIVKKKFHVIRIYDHGKIFRLDLDKEIKRLVFNINPYNGLRFV